MQTHINLQCTQSYNRQNDGSQTPRRNSSKGKLYLNVSHCKLESIQIPYSSASDNIIYSLNMISQTFIWSSMQLCTH